eukprot:1589905-Rhodomonas_salina.1
MGQVRLGARCRPLGLSATLAQAHLDFLRIIALFRRRRAGIAQHYGGPLHSSMADPKAQWRASTGGLPGYDKDDKKTPRTSQGRIVE